MQVSGTSNQPVINTAPTEANTTANSEQAKGPSSATAPSVGKWTAPTLRNDGARRQLFSRDNSGTTAARATESTPLTPVAAVGKTPEQMLVAAQIVSAALEQTASSAESPGFCITGSAAFLAYGIYVQAGDLDVVVNSMPHMQAAAKNMGYTQMPSPMNPHLPATANLPTIDILMAGDFGFPTGPHDTEIQNGVRVPKISILKQNLQLDRRVEKAQRNIQLLSYLEKIEAELSAALATKSPQP